MKTILYIADKISNGQLRITPEVIRIEAERQEVTTYGADGRYITWHSVDCERLGYDTYSFELEEREFTMEEINDYMEGPFKADLKAYNEEKRVAVARIAFLSSGISSVMEEILELAHKYNVPADIKVGKTTNDFRLIDAVDWDSSSMYC